MPELTDVLYSVDRGVATITINRPEKLNAFREQTLDDLIAAFEAADEDQTVGVTVLTGAGDRAFSSGGDVGDEAEFTSHSAWRYNRRCLQLAALMRNSGKPIIARINGYAVGGGNELNLLCDLAIASSTAKLGQAGARVGSVPVLSATQMLPRLIGERRAREVMFMCKQYTAQQAYEMGWVNAVVEPDQLDAEVRSWADQLLEKSPTALMITKLQLNHATDELFPAVISGFRMLNMGLHGTPEQHEGMTAFLEKRKPDFNPYRW